MRTRTETSRALNSLSEFAPFGEMLALLTKTHMEWSQVDREENPALFEAWERAAESAWEAVTAVGDAFLEYQCALALRSLNIGDRRPRS